MNLPFILPTPINRRHGGFLHEPIIAEMLKKHRLYRYELYTKYRHNKARHECWHRLQIELGWTLKCIGDEFGVTTETVLYGIRRHRGEPGRNRGGKKPARHTVSIGGVTMCLTHWAQARGINPSTVYMRINRGWSVERALSDGALTK